MTEPHYRTHCRLCGQHIAAGVRYFTLTVPFGPVIGVECEECAPDMPAEGDAA
jgi:hypothetical protein